MEASVRQHLQKLVVGSHPNQKKGVSKVGSSPKRLGSNQNMLETNTWVEK